MFIRVIRGSDLWLRPEKAALGCPRLSWLQGTPSATVKDLSRDDRTAYRRRRIGVSDELRRRDDKKLS
ncbi:MAG TPA: hypothetical protein VFC46_03815, partial [Humisphaera sp.]|nr:hypothetical protein [Humisphaera sp.]